MRTPRVSRAAGLLAVAPLALLATARPAEPAEPAAGHGTVALKAGKIHLVEDGRVLEDGTILVKDGKIVAVGVDLDVPPSASVVDYGPDAVIVPGLVAASSPYTEGFASLRTASPGTRAADAFDPYSSYAGALAGGVTSAYVTPASSRLIAGTGAMVKLAGDDHDDRVLNDRAAIHGAIDATARRTPGYWEPPVPATADTGMDFARPQLPRTTMGAVVALEELVGAVRDGDPDGEIAAVYGEDALADLAPLMEAGTPWRMAAVEPNEIRALLEFAGAHDLALIVDKAHGAADLADEIAAAGAAVVFRVPYTPNSGARDRGKDEDVRWPRFDVPVVLSASGVRFAIAGSRPHDLLFSAGLASRGGLASAATLRAITLTPAELHGVDDRIGSLRVGKDADFCVLNGEPFSGHASVLATWVDGAVAWKASTVDATVIEVAELHVGDGRVLRPGQLLLQGGEIAEVAQRVSHPRGATVVRGEACMPGIIDAFGHLGLEGSRKVPSTDFALKSIVGPGDDADRRVASHGITTVVLTPRGASKTGSPVMAYKPAGADFEEQIVGDPVALRLSWKDDNRLEAGEAVTELLAKAAEYRQKWIDYETAMGSWTPPPPEPADEEEEEEEGDDEKKEDDSGDEKTSKSKKSKKKKKDEPLEPDPITGVWEAELDSGESLFMRLHFPAGEGSGEVLGNLRCGAVSADLVEVLGAWDREGATLDLSGLGSDGWVSVEAKIDDGKLAGKLRRGTAELDFEAQRTSKEHVVAKRPERRKVEEEKVEEPKGKPKAPRLDPKLEPLRRAMDGTLSVVVEVDREDEILDCVAAFEEHGIEPILFGAPHAYRVAEEISGRVAGVLLSPQIRVTDPKRGTDYRTPYSDLQAAGIPVAFHSGAEEGAIDLPLAAAYAVMNGMSPTSALRALTSDAATMMSIDDRVGRLESGLDADVVLLDGPPLAPGTSVLRTWVSGEEVR
jgi:imidazolonepropionase-like amidohydrolase